MGEVWPEKDTIYYRGQPIMCGCGQHGFSGVRLRPSPMEPEYPLIICDNLQSDLAELRDDDHGGALVALVMSMKSPRNRKFLEHLVKGADGVGSDGR